MKLLNSLMLSCAAGLLTGCLVTSVAPFYTINDLVFEQSLVGDWSKADEPDEHWRFEKAGATAYQLDYSSGGKKTAVQAHLFKLQGHLFLDLFSSEQKEEMLPPPIPTHFLLRVDQLAPTVRMAPMDYEWLKEQLNKEPGALRHLVIRGSDNPDDTRVVLTADTSELQKFLLAHLKTEAAWKDGFVLQKQTVAPKRESSRTQ